MAMAARAFLSPEQAAWVFDTTSRTIRSWIVEGKLKTAPRLGRKHRIFVESVAEQAGLSVERVNEIVDAEERRQDEGNAINKPRALISATGVATR
jgi:predicted site-specific integrase-resolvase